MNRVGKYRGVAWLLVPLSRVFTHLGATRHYCIVDVSGEFTGDHFETLHELRDWVDTELIVRPII